MSERVRFARVGVRVVSAGVLAALLSVGAGRAAGGQASGGTGGPSRAAEVSAKGFDEAAGLALAVMRRRAEELGIGGVAVVAYFEGERVEGWSSRMAVVGRMKDEPKAAGPEKPADKGSNLLAIAYAKAAEMADTLKDSGSGVRPPMTGEFGWSGGVIVRGKAGYLIAAFSGGKSEDDVKVSRAGVEEMGKRM